MAKISIKSLLNNGSAKQELQNKVEKLTGVSFNWRPNNRISGRTLQAVIDLAEHKQPLFNESEIDSLRYENKAAKTVVLGMLCEALEISDLEQRKAIMTIASCSSSDDFVTKVLFMFV
ncbi:hypothetical protein KNV05_gp098 [Vibrio phage River4]|uniref:Uncharacterized protein n=1 Tax=Vibrio phage River4 TaxID=2736288 RepID=A0A6M9YZZ3_9CAUD|nr:hypothetical protein KNV05_gp014 [Vibrio phage River4]YP_010108043.1 hypothetical protein KNV05_gp098 [Vibrio phage River4]QKN84676.1 hypothetical protein RIVER4_14 [Vibrio phage River4]QKN84857.1 hypothetical protein RIVER4_218 [Vibrio phage River4]